MTLYYLVNTHGNAKILDYPSSLHPYLSRMLTRTRTNNFGKSILTIIYVIVCLVLIVIALMQSSEDDGASSTIMGGSQTGNFYEKNKGRTREGKLKRMTVILGIVFAIVTVALNIVYPLA